MITTAINKVIVLTPCKKKLRMNQRGLKKDNFGLYIECPFANQNCNCTCNVQQIG